MISKHITKTLRFFRVVKQTTDVGPLPSMIQYSLYNDSGEPLSFWNDIPFGLSNDTVNCVIEIPKEKHGKFQVKKNLPYHPIMQDTRKNIFTGELELRFYSQFPLFNYGYIPQTWEQNIQKDEKGLFGDDDPIDICDLSEIPKKCGDVVKSKILGSFCLIDQGQVDWKIIVIDEKQAQQQRISSIEDIDPRRLQSMKKWFKIVKVFDGKKPNTIAHDEKIFNKQQTIEVIKQTRRQWINLVTSQNEQIQRIRRKHQLKRIKTQDIKS